MNNISDRLLGMLERLAEMFPNQRYQSDLERYIASKNPTNAAEVEYWTTRYTHNRDNWRVL